MRLLNYETSLISIQKLLLTPPNCLQILQIDENNFVYEGKIGSEITISMEFYNSKFLKVLRGFFFWEKLCVAEDMSRKHKISKVIF
jgi:hypothetical protein